MYEQMLAYFNITQSTMEYFILAVVAIIIVGTIVVTYGKFLIVGAVACFCFTVFTHGKATSANTTEEIITEKSERVVYMEDCLSLTHNPKMCEQLWKERNE